MPDEPMRPEDEETPEDADGRNNEDGDDEDNPSDEEMDAIMAEIDGDQVGDLYVPLSGSNVVTTSPITRNKILGLPSSFSNIADPDNRAFSSTILYDMRVANIIPGVPNFLGLDSDNIHTDQELLEQMVGGAFEEGDAGSITDYLTSESHSRFNSNDHRYYAFKPNYAEYFKYVQQMLSIVSVNMGLGVLYNFDDAVASSFTEGSSIPFYLDKASTITESANNDFGASQFEGALKGAAAIKREIDFIMGKNMTASELESEAIDDNEDNSLGAKVRTIFESLDDLTLKGGVDKVKTVLNGSHMMFPEIWQDSSFTKNYSLTFRFHTPYGTPKSVFNKVYVPFIALLALTLP